MVVVKKKAKKCNLDIRDCGLANYRETLDLQYALCEKRRTSRIPDTVLILEHPPVITLGARKSANKLTADVETIKQKGIDIVQIRRGGGTTAHNMGQLVFYPIMNLNEHGLGISEYIRKLEQIGIELLEQLGVKAERKKGFPGLWIGEKKIASVGVRVSKSVTCHGMAINIQNDLSIFDLIVPCGLEKVQMTSAANQTAREYSMTQVKKQLTQILKKHFS